MRLIDADALANEILSEYGAEGGTEDVNTIYGMVINAPTIDAETVCEHFYKGYCSRFEDGCFQHCGAKMDKE